MSWRSYCAVEVEALVGLFRAVDQALAEAKLRLADLETILICRGPGSLLGLRLAAMALVGWQSLPGWNGKPVWSYLSLEAAWWSLDQEARTQALALCCDYREGKWITLEPAGVPTKMEWHLRTRVELEAMAIPLYRIPQRYREQPAPVNAIPLAYDIRQFPRHLPHLNLEPCTTAVLELYEPDPATYSIWSHDRHRKET